MTTPLTIRESCFFGNTKRIMYGSPKFQSCFGDFSHTGIITTEVITNQLNLKGTCPDFSMHFTQIRRMKLKLALFLVKK